MLVLSRRVNESIQIGTDIEVMVIDVRGDVVRLGITAPQSTQIWRKELWDVIVNENKAAAEAPKTVGTPQLPLSAFSKLSKIPTVKVNTQEAQS
ncbi:MAG: carbon storage regulator CsrA [Synergistaceae bacterium]|nr:carbon storage regulator CsrA [Synergistaceae bacterium]MBQ7267557.1 carbon storage regulator CsrA [Synergistaceae bacterium]